MAELVVKQGSNNEQYIFEITDDSGGPRNITGFTLSLTVLDRFLKTQKFTTVLTPVSGSDSQVMWKTLSSQIPSPGFYDGEITITDTLGYYETYDRFAFVVKESKETTFADLGFDNWLVQI